jgi:hypothetical protein
MSLLLMQNDIFGQYAWPLKTREDFTSVLSKIAQHGSCIQDPGSPKCQEFYLKHFEKRYYRQLKHIKYFF